VDFTERKCQNLKISCPTVDYLKKIIETENSTDVKELATIPSSLQLCRKTYPYGIEINTCNRFLELFSSKDGFPGNTIELGLQNGLAGFGMALMTELDGDDSWISLLPNGLTPKNDEPLPV
jgi:hypothetical protein